MISASLLKGCTLGGGVVEYPEMSGNARGRIYNLSEEGRFVVVQPSGCKK